MSSVSEPETLIVAQNRHSVCPQGPSAKEEEPPAAENGVSHMEHLPSTNNAIFIEGVGWKRRCLCLL